MTTKPRRMRHSSFEWRGTHRVYVREAHLSMKDMREEKFTTLRLDTDEALLHDAG